MSICSRISFRFLVVAHFGFLHLYRMFYLLVEFGFFGFFSPKSAAVVPLVCFILLILISVLHLLWLLRLDTFQRMRPKITSVCFTFICCFIATSFSYCSAWGRNPQIIGPPVLEQVILSSLDPHYRCNFNTNLSSSSSNNHCICILSTVK